jgi:hypothetical protein
MNTNRNIPIDTLEDEIDAIRIKLYEQTKHMSAQQRADHVNQRAREIIKEHGLNIRILKAPPSDAPAKQA